MTDPERLFGRCEQRGDCLIWTGAVSARLRVDGTPTTSYGVMSAGGRQQYVHRLAHEWINGPIPAGYQVDHLCRNALCVNPKHLEAVTPEVNRQRQAQVTTTRSTCRSGRHALDEENTYVSPSGLRVCRTCARETRVAYQMKRKSA